MDKLDLANKAQSWRSEGVLWDKSMPSIVRDNTVAKPSGICEAQ